MKSHFEVFSRDVNIKFAIAVKKARELLGKSTEKHSPAQWRLMLTEAEDALSTAIFTLVGKYGPKAVGITQQEYIDYYKDEAI